MLPHKTLSFVHSYYVIINFKHHGMSKLTTLQIFVLIYEIMRCIIIITDASTQVVNSNVPETKHVSEV
jgi:hypothetical protein